MGNRGKSASPESRLALFLERLEGIVGSSRFAAVRDALRGRRTIAIRTNTLRVTPEVLRRSLEAAGFDLEPVPWYADAFLLRSGDRRELEATEAWQRGELYTQNLSSMIPPLILDPQPGEDVLDLAAAPGSKTTQIACLMRGEGRLVANDRSRSRFWRLKAVVEQQGVPHAELVCRPGESFGRTYPDAFDRVLVDAPCSAEGRFQLDRASTWRDWTLGKVRRCARVQGRLLRAAVKAVRPGGVIVYSTCTFAPEENEQVVARLLERSQGAVELEAVPASLSIPGALPGLTQWGERPFDSSLARCLRILPSAEHEAFFVARLRKIG